MISSIGLSSHAVRIGRMAKTKLPKLTHSRIDSGGMFPFSSLNCSHTRQYSSIPSKISSHRIEKLNSELNMGIKKLDLKNDPVSMIISGIDAGQSNFREYLISIAEEYFKKRKDKNQILIQFEELLDKSTLQKISLSVSNFYSAIQKEDPDALLQAQNTLRDLCTQLFDKALEEGVAYPPLL